MALNSTPNAADAINFTQPLILVNFDSINAGFAVDHNAFSTVAPYTASNEGKHKQVTFTSGGVAPAVAGEFGLYTAGGALRLNNVTGAYNIPISGTGAAQKAVSGWSYLPSGIIVQWGFVTATTSGMTTYNFPMTFPTSCTSITGNVQTANSTTQFHVVVFNTVIAASFKVGLQTNETPAPITKNIWYMALGY